MLEVITVLLVIRVVVLLVKGVAVSLYGSIMNGSIIGKGVAVLLVISVVVS